MESNYNNRDFEQFVKQNADQYRMFPSDKVWVGIDKALHTRRRWYGWGLAFLLVLTGAGVALVMLTTPANKQTQPVSTTLTGNSTLTAHKQTEFKEPVSLSNPTSDIAISHPLNFDNKPQKEFQTFKPNNNNTATLVADQSTVAAIPVADAPAESHKTIQVLQDNKNRKDLYINNSASSLSHTPVPSKQKEVATESTLSPAVEKTDEKNIVLIKPDDDAEYPLTIESVINSFKRTKPSRKISYQVYLTPTISYRKLSENKGFLQSAASAGNIPAFAAYNDVRNVVVHKPDIGLELGFTARYPLTKAIQVKAGLQFNVSRYDIKAYSYPGEIATIALDAGSNSSISRETTYRTRSGNKANWLQNLYYSASLPVGVEMKLIPGKNNSNYFGIAATIQPTYIISDRTYLLSTDFKNYVKVPSLTRNWNMNTSFEAFMSYGTGKTKWQVGPQIRYQIRSSFENKYPVKENLFDFGLKIGVTLNQ
ncbi:MAG: hypothetical protein J0L56_19745 [Chitinophagales bacterium]|nr:hypothetical protein [Chitinophagales bacterium]